MKLATYTMHAPGGTQGAVTGHHYTWAKGRTFTVPDGEFDHLGAGLCEKEQGPKRETTAAVPAREKAARVGLTKHHAGGGWYEVRRGDEVVETGLRKDDADQLIEDLS